MIHPEDDNGNALRRMETAGDNLCMPRNVDYSVVFPDEMAAERFAAHFRVRGYSASVEFSETVVELPWDVVVVNSCH